LKVSQLQLAEVNNFVSKLKEELIETNKNHSNLNEQFSNFSKSAHIQKTHFQIELLEKKMSSLELKYSVDKSNELDFGELLKNIESKKLVEDRPLRLTEILEKQSHYSRKRNSFSFNSQRK
jgi:hypothetical protein